jgi:hypothetical protein
MTMRAVTRSQDAALPWPAMVQDSTEPLGLTLHRNALDTGNDER